MQWPIESCKFVQADGVTRSHVIHQFDCFGIPYNSWLLFQDWARDPEWAREQAVAEAQVATEAQEKAVAEAQEKAIAEAP